MANRHDPGVPSPKPAQKVPLTGPLLLGLDPDQPLPDLAVEAGGTALVPGRLRSATLDVRYLDTADLRLLRAGVALSRRSLVARGAADEAPPPSLGADPGWVLELPRPRHGTSSVRLPLRGPSVAAPKQLSTLVRATVRTGRLATVARLRAALTAQVLSVPVEDDAEAPVLELVTRTCTATVPLPAGAAGGPGADGAAPAETPGGVALTTWREVELRPVEGDVPLKAKQLAALTEAVLAALTGAGAEVLDRPAGGTATAELARVVAATVPAAVRPPAPRRPAGAGEPGAGSPAGDVARAVVEHQLADLTAADRAVRSEHPDASDAMLTATARLRSALWLAAATTEPGSAEALREELARLEGLLGAARSARAVAAELDALLATQPADQVLGPVGPRLHAALQREVQASESAVGAALGDQRYFRLLDDLEAWVEDPPATSQAGSPAREVLLRRAAKAHWRLVDAVDAVDGAHDQARRDALLDRVRACAAHAGGLGEVLAPLAGKDAERYAAAVRAVEAALTRLDVTARSRALLRQLGVQAHLAHENGYTFGRLHAFEQVRGDDAEELFEQAWEQASRPRRRRWLG
jgi:CHAD domain-containing protein